MTRLSILEKVRKEQNDWLTMYSVGLEAIEAFLKTLEKYKHYKTFTRTLFNKFHEDNPSMRAYFSNHGSINFYKVEAARWDYRCYLAEKLTDAASAIDFFTAHLEKLHVNFKETSEAALRVDSDYQEFEKISRQLNDLCYGKSTFSQKYYAAYLALNRNY